MGKSTKVNAAPAPDPAIGIAAEKQAQLGADWLQESKRQFEVANDRQKVLDGQTEQVTAQQLASAQQAQEWATQDRARSVGVFQPLQDEFIAKARAWDSPERQQTVAAEAKADVLNSAAQARGTNLRQAAALGISPTSGRFAGVERAGEAATAVAAAGAQNAARNQVRQQGMALQAEAVNMGNGLAVNPAASLGLGLQAGSSALAATNASNAASRANLGILEGGYKTAMSGYGAQATTLTSLNGQKLSAWSEQQKAQAQQGAANSQGIGSAIGSIAGMAMMFSSKDVKENKRPVRGALEAVENMPVEEWSYKEGVGDGGRHIGPYAEDFQRETGRGDGKTINIIDAIGINMRATQELAEEVRSLRGVTPRRAKPSGRGITQREAA